MDMGLARKLSLAALLGLCGVISSCGSVERSRENFGNYGHRHERNRHERREGTKVSSISITDTGGPQGTLEATVSVMGLDEKKNAYLVNRKGEVLYTLARDGEVKTETEKERRRTGEMFESSVGNIYSDRMETLFKCSKDISMMEGPILYLVVEDKRGKIYMDGTIGNWYSSSSFREKESERILGQLRKKELIGNNGEE